MTTRRKPALVLLVGPTAVGKSDLAIRLAEQVDAEIISADSRLFYRGMDIGTAKPSPADQRRVRHHLIDIADPDESVSLTQFQRLARQAILDIHARESIPLLVGGTGQYVRAVVQGWQPPRVEPDEGLRSVLESLDLSAGGGLLHRGLERMDPEAATAIDASNRRRTIRALEVIFKTGRRFSQQRVSGESPYELLTLGLKRPRPDLFARVDARIEAMFASGLLDEVRGLLARGYSEELPAMSAIGYRQCIRILRGQLTEQEAKADIRRSTRIFVRRQANWFRESDPTIRWLDASAPALLKIATSHVRRFLPQPRAAPD